MNKASIGLVGLVLLIALAWLSLYTVDETEQVIILQFGKPVGNAITEPGLHVKVPLIQQPVRLEKRYLEWDGDPNQVPTRDKRFIEIDTYGRWRITDPLLYYKRLRDERGAQSRLDDILDGAVRNAVARYDLVEIVRSSNREFTVIEENVGRDQGEEQEVFSVEVGRPEIEREVLEKSREGVAELGIEVLDFRFKRINYVEEVQRRVFERMISERERIADLYRSEGQGEAFRINGERERELLRIQSEAQRDYETIRGQADSTAAAIFNLAYNRDATSRAFYSFQKTLETWEKTFDKETQLILGTGSEVFRLLQDAEAGR